MSNQLQAIAQGLATEFAAVLGSLLGTEATSGAFDGAIAPAWAIPCRIDAPTAGLFFLGLSRSRRRGPRRAAPHERRRAERSGRRRRADRGRGTGVCRPRHQGVGRGAGWQRRATAHGAGAAGRAGRRLRVRRRREPRHARALLVRGGARETGARACGHRRSARGVADAGSQWNGRRADNLDVILDIDMPLSVRFGEAVLSLDLLTRLGPGSLIELSRQPDDPVDVLINGRLVARGEVVVVSGNYGVRVTEVVSAAERLRSMGA